MCDAVRAVAALDDPVGEVVTGWRLPNGLDVQKVRVPLGVLLVVYEARPNVTVDVASLCLKSGNACLLRGSTAPVLPMPRCCAACARASEAAGLPEDAVVPLEATREELAAIVADPAACDVVIPRGGESLKTFLLEHARVPVLVAAGGNCHVYLHADADPAKALPIVINAKTQRPGVCNACETLLVHRDALPLLGPIGAELAEHGVELRADAESAAGSRRASLPADEDDWATEFLDLVLAVRTVGSVEEAIEHIERYSTGHSEAIVTESIAAADDFVRGISSACVYVNASTRFTDGGSSASAPRSATRRRGCTPAGRSAWPTSRRRSTSCAARARSAPEIRRDSGAARRSRCGRRGPSSSRGRTRARPCARPRARSRGRTRGRDRGS